MAKTTTANTQKQVVKKTHGYQTMTKLALVLWATGVVRLHQDGDSTSGVFRVWHPLTWRLLLVPCALMGERLLEVVPLKLSKFWRDNIDQFQPVKPWTRLDTLKPFRFKLKTASE